MTYRSVKVQLIFCNRNACKYLGLDVDMPHSAELLRGSKFSGVRADPMEAIPCRSSLGAKSRIRRCFSHHQESLKKSERRGKGGFMRTGRYLLLFALAVLSLIAADVARADVYGRIRGTVTDPNGAIIPKAKVVAINTGTGITTQTVSGQDGNYEFLQLAAPAIYNVTAEISGFKKVEVDGIHLELNQIFVENLHLELGSVAEKVGVVEKSIVQVETTSIELGTTI